MRYENVFVVQDIEPRSQLVRRLRATEEHTARGEQGTACLYFEVHSGLFECFPGDVLSVCLQAVPVEEEPSQWCDVPPCVSQNIARCDYAVCGRVFDVVVSHENSRSVERRTGGVGDTRTNLMASFGGLLLKLQNASAAGLRGFAEDALVYCMVTRSGPLGRTG